MAEVEETQDSSAAKEEVKEEDMESQIQRAMRSRVPYFKDQSDSLTFEGVRRVLEKDLGLEKCALDIHKRYVKQCLLECLNRGDDENGSKSSGETVEKNVDTGKEVAGSPEKEQMKKDVKEASSEDEEKMEDSPVMGLLTEHKKTKVQTKKSQVEKKKVPTESTVKEAVKKRASYLKANSEKITMAGVRQLLAEDLDLDKDTLLPFKKFISQQVDEVLKSPKVSEPTSGVKKKTTAKTSSSKASKESSGEESSDSLNSESEEIEEVKSKKKIASKKETQKSEEPKKRKRPAKEETKDSSKKRSKQAETSEENSAAGGSASEDDHSHSEKPVKKKEVATPAYGKRVEHLKSVIKSCGMSVPPAVYKRVKLASENKREASLIKELEEILSREGVSTDPSEKEIKEVRKRKDRAKELEGIDMSNIVSSTRRRSTTSFVPPQKPKTPVKSDGDKAGDKADDKAEDKAEDANDADDADDNEEEEEEEEEDDDDDDDDDDDSQSEEFNEDEDDDSD